jgi:basic membrane protein A
MKIKNVFCYLFCFFLVFSIVTSCEETKKPTEEKKIKAGFIYIGPVGDLGWTHAHEQGRLYVQEQFPWLETVTVESVPEGEAIRFIDRLISEEMCDVVFTTSFGYMDSTIAAGEEYPDKIFMHCSGFKQIENVGTYFAELYQMYYLNGLMAAALTKTNKIGYVGAFPIPEVIRHIDAFALGVKEVNPDAKVYVKWIYSWYSPAEAREAAESLIAEGVDALAFTEDSSSVVEVGQEHSIKGEQIYTFSHYSPMQDYGPDSVVSGQLVDWGIMYEKILKDIYEDKWTSEDLWWLAAEGAAQLGGCFCEPINNIFVEELKNINIGSMSVYDLVMQRLEEFKKTPVGFEPFTGPIYDNKGNLQLKDGEVATKEQLLSMMYYVDNIEGEIPQE